MVAALYEPTGTDRIRWWWYRRLRWRNDWQRQTAPSLPRKDMRPCVGVFGADGCPIASNTRGVLQTATRLLEYGAYRRTPCAVIVYRVGRAPTVAAADPQLLPAVGPSRRATSLSWNPPPDFAPIRRGPEGKRFPMFPTQDSARSAHRRKRAISAVLDDPRDSRACRPSRRADTGPCCCSLEGQIRSGLPP